MESIDMIVNRRGFDIVRDTAAHSGTWIGYEIWLDAIVAELDINYVAVNLTTIKFDGLTQPYPMSIVFPESQRITRIKLTSGILKMIRGDRV